MAIIPEAPGLGGRAPAATVDFREEITVPAKQNPRRRQALSIATWAAIASAILREHAALPPHDPRVRPTLPRLAFMQDPRGGRP